jgi:hypothetical protein
VLAGSDGPGGQPNDVVEVANEALLQELTPDIDAVAALGSTGLIVTAAADGDGDFVSRYFAPAVGIDEDPVTGSAHSTLGPLWAERLGRDRLTARQISPRRGRLTLHVQRDRVHVGGQATTVIRGAPARGGVTTSLAIPARFRPAHRLVCQQVATRRGGCQRVASQSRTRRHASDAGSINPMCPPGPISSSTRSPASVAWAR